MSLLPTTVDSTPVLHIMYNGESHDIPLSRLDIGRDSTDEQIKAEVANYFSFPADKLRFHAVDRHETGNITVRPQAVFGQ